MKRIIVVNLEQQEKEKKMPKYEGNMGNIPLYTILPKEEYEFLVGEPKPFETEDNEGIRYPLTIMDEKSQYYQQKVYYTVWTHSEGGWRFGKLFLMAALGFSQETENDYNAEAKELNWGYDATTGEVGDGWESPIGKRVMADVDIQTNPKNPNQQNNQFSFFPIDS